MVSDFKEDGVPTLQNRKDKHIKQELEGFLFQVGMFGHALLPNQFAPSEMSMHSCPTTWCGHPGPVPGNEATGHPKEASGYTLCVTAGKVVREYDRKHDQMWELHGPQ